MNDPITLAHGAGGRQTAALIEQVFVRHFKNPMLTADDAAILPESRGRTAFTTDGFIVSPWEFPGGNIGKLSVCGTVNDLCCMGAVPQYLTCGFIIEEGFSLSDLEKITQSMAQTAGKAGVRIAAGDTKVVGCGQADSIFITTSGIGHIPDHIRTSGAMAKPGDAVIVTGDIGRHGCAILLARDNYGIAADISSDCAPLTESAQAAYTASHRIHVMRDATRGGVGTVLYEITRQSHIGIRLDAAAIPVDPGVRSVCDMLGLDPMYLACEGRMVILAPKEDAAGIVTALSAVPESRNAAVIGEVTAEHAGHVILHTPYGTQTILPEPTGELLPRIC